MHHLSRASLRLNPARGFSATYLMHQLVADLLRDRDDRGYLFRVLSRGPAQAEVLVLSDERPVPESQPREWGVIDYVESRPYTFEPTTGQQLDYEIRLNATRVVTDAQGRKSRVDVWDAQFRADPGSEFTPHDIYRDYLERRLGEGADIATARVVERGFEKAARPGRASIRFVSTNLIGSLKVGDPATFLNAVTSGIGRSKAFGQGLLCLSRPGSILPRRYGGRGIV